MSFDVLTATPFSGATRGTEVRFSYPSGRTREDYESTGASLVVGSDTYRQSDEVYSLSYEDAGPRVLWSGPTLAAGITWTLRAPLSRAAAIANGNPLTIGSVSRGVGEWLADAVRRPMIVTNRGQMCSSGTAAGGTASNFTKGDYRQKVTFGPFGCSDLQVIYGNYYVPNAGVETAGPNAITVEAAIETSTGTTIRLTFKGESSATIQPGVGVAISDPLGIDFAAGDTAWLRTSVTVTSGGTWPSAGLFFSATGDGMYEGTGPGQVGGTGNMSTPSGGRIGSEGYPPLAIVGVPDRAARHVAIVGDSISLGYDDTGDSQGNFGHIARGLYNATGGAIPYTRLSRVGVYARDVAALSDLRKRLVFGYASDVIFHIGSNDITLARSFAQITADLTALWTAAKRRGCRVRHCNIIPRTSSSDNWTTAANQTPISGFGAGGLRDQINAWMAAQVGQGLLDQLIDVSKYYEDPSDPTKWASNGTSQFATKDGIHPRTSSYTTASEAIRLAMAAA